MSNFYREINGLPMIKESDTIVTEVHIGETSIIETGVVVKADEDDLYIELDDGCCNMVYAVLDPVTMRISLCGKDIGRAYVSGGDLGKRRAIVQALSAGIQRVMDLPSIGNFTATDVYEFLDSCGITDTQVYHKR